MSHSKTDNIPEGWKAPNGMWVLKPGDPALNAYAQQEIDLELFAGPGGFSEGRKMAGEPSETSLGIEWDASACMTATAAGHPRLHADIALLDPRPFGKVRLLHGSPPCQGFSPAGKGESRGDMDLLLWAIREMAASPERCDEIMATARHIAKSPLSALSLEPLRWALLLRPEAVTLEQVKTVLPLWEAYAVALRANGYSVWTGIISTEIIGVPQTRERAILVASRVRDVSHGITKTHSRYIRSGKLKGVPEPGFKPFITMAQALGWGMTQRPYVTVAVGTKTGGTDPMVLGGSGARRTVHAELNGDRWTGKPLALPDAHVLTDDEIRAAGGWGMTDRPSYTFCNSGNGGAGIEWGGQSVREEMIARDEQERGWIRKPEAANEGTTDADMQWAFERPSATIVGSFHPEVVAKPAYRKAGDGPRQKALGSIRVTVQEAGILQSFPADYPWQGNQTKQYEQVGNAVPPLLGKAMTELALGKAA